MHLFDKHIANRYDNMSGSKYFITIVYLLFDEVLTMEDTESFDKDVRERLLNSVKILNKDIEKS